MIHICDNDIVLRTSPYVLGHPDLRHSFTLKNVDLREIENFIVYAQRFAIARHESSTLVQSYNRFALQSCSNTCRVTTWGDNFVDVIVIRIWFGDATTF